MENYKLTEAQLVLWESKKGFQRGVMVGLQISSKEGVNMIVIESPKGGELARMTKREPKWEIV